MDVGCGQGDLLESFALPGWKIYGLEPSQAKKRIQHGNVHIFHGTLEEFNWFKQYEAIILFATLEHLPQPDRSLRILHNALPSQGYLFLEVPDSMRPQGQISEFYCFEHLTHFTVSSLANLLNRCGFEVIGRDTTTCNHSLRIVCRKSDHADQHALQNDGRELLAIINKYKKRRQNLIHRITGLFEKLLSTNSQIALYGAGEHSDHLLDSFDVAERIVDVFDSDPKKWGTFYHKWHVKSPDQLSKCTANAVIISSFAFQEEMAATVIKHNSSVKVIRLYSEYD